MGFKNICLQENLSDRGISGTRGLELRNSKETTESVNSDNFMTSILMQL